MHTLTSDNLYILCTYQGENVFVLYDVALVQVSQEACHTAVVPIYRLLDQTNTHTHTQHG